MLQCVFGYTSYYITRCVVLIKLESFFECGGYSGMLTSRIMRTLGRQSTHLYIIIQPLHILARRLYLSLPAGAYNKFALIRLLKTTFSRLLQENKAIELPILCDRHDVIIKSYILQPLAVKFRENCC